MVNGCHDVLSIKLVRAKFSSFTDIDIKVKYDDIFNLLLIRVKREVLPSY